MNYLIKKSGSTIRCQVKLLTCLALTNSDMSPVLRMRKQKTGVFQLSRPPARMVMSGFEPRETEPVLWITLLTASQM